MNVNLFFRLKKRSQKRKVIPKDTKALNTIGYRYTAKRKELHRRIIHQFIKKVDLPKKEKRPLAILIGGGTATGKTFMRLGMIKNKLKDRKIKAITIDPDEIKTYIPEYKLLSKKHPPQAAHLVHRESCDIGAALLNRLIKERKHFIYEGTMARKNKYIKLVNRLKKTGYEVQIFVSDVPLNLAKDRAVNRAKQTGRKVPSHVIENTHRLVPLTFEALKEHVDYYEVYNTEEGLFLIVSNNYINHDQYARFLKKGKQKTKNDMDIYIADDILNRIDD